MPVGEVGTVRQTLFDNTDRRRRARSPVARRIRGHKGVDIHGYAVYPAASRYFPHYR